MSFMSVAKFHLVSLDIMINNQRDASLNDNVLQPTNIKQILIALKLSQSSQTLQYIMQRAGYVRMP